MLLGDAMKTLDAGLIGWCMGCNLILTVLYLCSMRTGTLLVHTGQYGERVIEPVIAVAVAVLALVRVIPILRKIG